ncbi:MAG: lysophospholipid acyltransferase family protein [Mailhella sp.]|nr:lysophospholipid acyltransferase family protein [Mailhella sp.]
MREKSKQIIKNKAGNLRRKIRDLFRTSDFCVDLLVRFYKVFCKSLQYDEKTRVRIAEQDDVAARRKQGEDVKGTPVVLCLWHDELFPLIYLRKDLDIVCIVSGSKDGAVLEKFMRRTGLRTAAGSSRRGGLKALLHAAKLMKDGTIHACITVDGPMGPRHKAKDGAFLLAQKANAKIMPVRLNMENSYAFPSWDKFQIPLPFSKVEVIFGEGFFVTEELTEEYLAACRKRLEEELTKLLPQKP